MPSMNWACRSSLQHRRVPNSGRMQHVRRALRSRGQEAIHRAPNTTETVMKHKKVKWKTEHRPLSELKPHPKNVIFADLSDAALDELASDMDAHGQEHPIDILPDGTVIGGHQRLRAARRLGWKTIRCRVRFDLAAAGEVAIEEFLLRDNLLRRQLDPIEVARVYRRLKELAKNNGRAFKGDVRDLIAKRFGKSGRTLDRWLRLLDTPLEVQNAVIAGTLRLVDGGKVADLPEDLREEIADRLRSGQAPKKVVSKYIGNRSTKPVNVGTGASSESIGVFGCSRSLWATALCAATTASRSSWC